MAEKKPLLSSEPPPYEPNASLTQPPTGAGYQATALPFSTAPLTPPTVSRPYFPPPIVDLGEQACVATCPTCKTQVNSVLVYKNGKKVKKLFLLLFLIGFLWHLMWFGLCCLPFCMKSCKDVIHVCPVCRTELGRKTRDFKFC